MKAIFCGTPEIALPALDALTEVARVVGVVCQPDRPAGRGMKLRAPAVKERALSLGLEVLQPTKVRDGSLARWIRDKDADVALVIAYGRILGPDVLTAPRLGCLNLHASILPEYRGAAPIQRALMDGKTETGVCLMQMDEGMDTGPVLACHTQPILPVDNSATLAAKLGTLAGDVVREELPRFFAGQLSPSPQDEHRATYAPPLKAEDAELHFDRPARELSHRIRGLAPRPGATATIVRSGTQPRRLKILVAVSHDSNLGSDEGEVAWEHGRLLVGTAEGTLEILEAQIEGRKVQSAKDLYNGRGLLPGDRLEATSAVEHRFSAK